MNGQRTKGLMLLEMMLSMTAIIALLSVIVYAWVAADSDRKATTIARQAITSLMMIKGAYRHEQNYEDIDFNITVARKLYDPSLVEKGGTLIHAGGQRIFLERNNTTKYDTGLPNTAGIQATIRLSEVSQCLVVMRELDTVAVYLGVWGVEVKPAGGVINDNQLWAACSNAYLGARIQSAGWYTVAAVIL